MKDDANWEDEREDAGLDTQTAPERVAAMLRASENDSNKADETREEADAIEKRTKERK